ncbi:MAG: putative LPS assembly protein LptD [Bacteroidota bacterium]|uniref:putative LPS assembly protein LptD n=2 Tax=Roseivirgaceae TaxID=2762306 RepID=UPI001673AEE6|nr:MULTISPECIES: putative LPS assembly protein LptD [Roseivirga]MEC7752693.1 putative LPS assembly protein LptD [Bacteroidota bacterium]
MRMKRLIEITLRKNLKNSEKPKFSVFSNGKIFFIVLAILCTSSLKAQFIRAGQESRQNRAEAEQPVKNDTVPGISDSLQVVVGGIQTTIKYYAEDSIITKLLTNQTYLYGNAKIEYGNIKLVAERITIDKNKNELMATGIQDSLGNWVGRPIFQDGPDIFDTEEIRYNFETQKAIIKGVATKQQDGHLRGSVVKRNADQSAYIKDGKFIPCLDDPDAGTYIKSSKIKINPGKNVITGPFLLYVGDIPTPLGLPFGYFPDTQESTSGILFPKYGDERRRGLFLKEGGYYFAWNDNIHTAVTADYYSKGSWATRIRSVYKQRYKFSGQFDLTYNRNITPDYEVDALDSKDFWVSWSHRPDSRGRNGRFSASVNAGTSTYNQNNLGTVNLQNNIRSEFRSNVQYSGVIPRSPFSYSFSARHNQNVQTGIIDISLPEMSLNMNRVYPLQNSDIDLLKRFNFGWRFNASNQITNIVRPGSAGFQIANKAEANDTIAVGFDTLGELLDNAKNGARHNIDVSTSFSALTYLNFSPSFQIEELWYLEELQYEFLEDQNAVRIDTINGFSRSMTYSAGIGMTTQLYGMFNFKRSRRVEAIRHIMTPSVSFSYRPDFSDPKYGYYQLVQTDTTGGGRFRLLSKYDGFRFGTPSLGESAALGFSLNNKFEMKVKSDTAKSEKVALLESLNLQGSYNFLADSFRLSPIQITARTTLFDRKLNINMGATLDPYAYLPETSEGVTTLRPVDVLAIRSGQGLGRITSARFSLSTNLNSRASAPMGGGGRFGGESIGVGDFGGDGFGNNNENEYGSLNDGGGALAAQMGEYFYDPNAYVDVEIPWNIRLSYDYSYRWTPTNQVTRQSVKAHGQVALTPKWQITYNTGYDFFEKEFTTTSIGLYRDLGCWEMRGNWIPFGAFTSYTIDIQIKSSVLKDLKISRRRSQFENNRGGFSSF